MNETREAQGSAKPAVAHSETATLLEAARRLSKLSRSKYELVRVSEAKTLNITLRVLDSMVLPFIKDSEKSEAEATAESELENGIAPWGEPVDGVELVSLMFDDIKKHVVLSDYQAVIVVTWIIGTFCFNAFGIFPKLLITSPEKRCGKSTLMGVLRCMVNRELSCAGMSASAVFRSIEEWQPTLLLDEGDTFINSDDEGLRGVINSGHKRDMAAIVRVEGEGMERKPKRFSTWAPMIIAMIGLPPGTIVDRSVHIQLRRRLKHESVEGWHYESYYHLKSLRQKLKRWADDNIEQLKESPYLRFNKLNIPILSNSNDRVGDNWLPLFAIASLISGEWLARLEEAFKILNNVVDNEDDYGSLKVELLSDIRDIFHERNCHEIYSSDLVDDLVKLEHRPWADFKFGKPITPHAVAKLLKHFKVAAKKLCLGMSGKRGYFLADFEEIFKRYL